MIPVLDRLLYLASPYTDESAAVREARGKAVARVAGMLIATGRMVYSPVAHGVPIEASGAMAGHFEAWRRHNFNMIARCNDFAVLALPGWCKSEGVTGEIEIALDLGRPVDILVERSDGSVHVVDTIKVEELARLRAMPTPRIAVSSWVRMRTGEVPA